MKEIPVLNIEKVLELMKLKFTSGNSMPVERTTITLEEWRVVEQMLEDYLKTEKILDKYLAEK